jgi:hypothetical protein
MFLDGGAGAADGGGVSGFERLNPMMISGSAQYTPQNVSAQQIEAMMLDAPPEVRAQILNAPPEVRAQMLNAPPEVRAMMLNAPPEVRAQMLQEMQGSGLLGQMNTQARNAGPSAVAQALDQRAMEQLALGGGIGEQDQRALREATRTAYAGRGMYEGNAAITDEVLNLDREQRARMLERTGMAMSIDAQNEAQRQNLRGYGLAVEGANQGMMGLNNQRAMANQSAGLQAAMANQDATLRTGLANQSTGLQADMANQDATLRTGMANQSANLSAAQANQGASLQAAIANQGAGLTANQQYLQALMADQGTRMQADQYNSQQALSLAQSNASAGASANNAYIARYIEALKYNNSLTGMEFDAGQVSLGNRMADKIDPMAVTMEMLNPYNQYAQQLNVQNYEGAWSGYNAQANALAAIASGNAANAAASSAAGANVLGAGIGGASNILAAWLGNKDK